MWSCSSQDWCPCVFPACTGYCSSSNVGMPLIPCCFVSSPSFCGHRLAQLWAWLQGVSCYEALQALQPFITWVQLEQALRLALLRTC
jgi:hypothetical protein